MSNLGLPVAVMEPEPPRDDANRVAEIVAGDIRIRNEELQYRVYELIDYPVAIVPRGIPEPLGCPQIVIEQHQAGTEAVAPRIPNWLKQRDSWYRCGR